MKQRKFDEISIHVANGMYIYTALLLLLIPIRLLLPIIICATLHELFHIAAIRLVGKKVYSVCIAPRGTIIQTQSLSDREEVICAIAGPISGLLLLLLFRWIPVIALVGAMQSLYNLLPLYPTDGGRVLQRCVRRFFSIKTADNIIYWTEILTLCVIMAISFYGTFFLNLGIVPAALSFWMLIKSSKLK